MQYSYEGFIYTFIGEDFMYMNKTYKREDYKKFVQIYKFLKMNLLSENDKFEVDYWKHLGKIVSIHQSLRKMDIFR
jgi:hypothetical protein